MSSRTGSSGARTPGSISRRRALAALAAIPALAPLARRLRAEGMAPPKRLVVFMQNNGTQQANFWPTGVGADGNPIMSSPILDALFHAADGTDNGLAGKSNLIKGVFVPNDANGTNGNQHDMGFARMFTGEKLVSRGGSPWAGGPSVDQILAGQNKCEPLTLAVLASSIEPTPKPGFDHRRSFCYRGAATLKYPLVDPLRVYHKLFPEVGAAMPSRQRLLLRQSVLDAVAANASDVAARLGKDDGQKLDYHLSAIRDVETRLSTQLGKAPPVCSTRPAPPRDFTARDANAEVAVDTYIPEMVDNMIDLGAAALACDLTRIVTIQLGYGGGKWNFWWQGINMNCHDDVAHRDIGDAGGDPANTERVVLMNQYYASRVARLATALNAIPEGAGTMLDNTLIVWANELGRGDHSAKNVPIVLLGMVGAGIPAGGRVIDTGEQVFNRLGCTVLNLMGDRRPGFGDQPTCGPFQGLI
jgi:hypothetical protein